MNCSEFFHKFYLSRTEGGLVGYKSKKKIPEFFFTSALDEAYWPVLPTSDSTYEKWFDGKRNPDGGVWSALNNHFCEDELLKALLRTMNEGKLRDVMRNFEIRLDAGEVPNPRQFAIAIKDQFRALASGNGTAENVVPEAYIKTPEPVRYGAYIRNAAKKFKWMRLPGEDECLMSEFFVCNSIGTSLAVFPHRVRGSYIREATLDKIRTSDRRGEIRCALLIGSCGYGKTLMLQHLFIEAAEHGDTTGLFPVFAELRNFSSRYDDFVPFLADTVKEYDPAFTEGAVRDILEKGQAQILLDGLDELDPGEVNCFQRRLAELCQRFPNNMVVITSRQCSAMNGIRGFVRLFLHPLDDGQVEELIDRLLAGEQDEAAKNTVLSFFDPVKGYVRRNGFVATNPMLLTIMVRNYRKLKSFRGNKIQFYELLYDALIRGHDEEKPAFDRFFHSVANGDEFTQVFREFCALAFMDGVFEFDHRSFEKYCKQLKSRNALINPAAFQLQAFQHDVCVTACMMYEQESGIYYIDPGFQDYLFAEYYYFEDSEPTKAMGRSLWDRRPDSFRNLDALRMLYQMSRDKMEVCILLPFLDCIFRGKTEEEAFLRYLEYGYGDVVYTVYDETAVRQSLLELKADRFDTVPDINDMRSIVLAVLLDRLALPNAFAIGAWETAAQRGGGATHFLSGFLTRTPERPDEAGLLELRTMRHDIRHAEDRDYFDGMEYAPVPVRDHTGKPVCFGYVYRARPLSLNPQSEQLRLLMELAKKNEVYGVFIRVREYYKQIVDRQKVNDYR